MQIQQTGPSSDNGIIWRLSAMAQRVLLLLSAWLCLGASFAIAQPPPPAAPVVDAAPIGPIYARGFVIESVIVVVMLGLALFVICRGSSRR